MIGGLEIKKITGGLIGINRNNINFYKEEISVKEMDKKEEIERKTALFRLADSLPREVRPSTVLREAGERYQKDFARGAGENGGEHPLIARIGQWWSKYGRKLVGQEYSR